MLMQKGPLPKYLVHLLRPLLEWRGVFSKTPDASSGLSRLYNLPEQVQAAVRQVIEKSSWEQAEVYSFGNALFVFGSDYRLSPKKELYYPLLVEGGLKQALLVEAQVAAQASPLRFLWRDKEGRVGICFIPFIGVMGLSSSVHMMAVPEVAYGMALLGIFALLFVPVYGYFKRDQFREALARIWANPPPRPAAQDGGPVREL